jgi:hypothetical protein
MESRGEEYTREDHAGSFGIGINRHRSVFAGLK